MAKNNTLRITENRKVDAKHGGDIFISKGIEVDGDVTSTGGNVINSGKVRGNVEAKNDIINYPDSKIAGDATAGRDINNRSASIVSGNATAGRDIENLESSIISGDATADRDIDNLRSRIGGNATAGRDIDNLRSRIDGNVVAKKITNEGTILGTKTIISEKDASKIKHGTVKIEKKSLKPNDIKAEKSANKGRTS